MAATRPLRIAWLGGAPLETGGAPGVVTELLHGLAERGHRIDCFFPGTGYKLPERVAEQENLTFVWGTSEWRWNRWYSRVKVAAFATGLISRGLASLRLRREIAHRHAQEPYDLIYQNQTIESPGIPSSVARRVPIVIRPDSHMAGELRCLIRERKLSFRCQPHYIFFTVAAIMAVRALVQRFTIRRADLLLCISSVFRDHMVHDYGFPLEHTVVITNPVRLERFAQTDRPLKEPPIVLVPGRISVRKGIEDVIEVAKVMRERDVDARIRVVGGPSLWSDYTKLLEDLPPENTENVGKVPPSEMPAEFDRGDIMLQASKYDPCPMAVIEALAAGLPVVATTEVGSVEGVDRSVVSVVQPGDVGAMVAAIEEMLERVRARPAEVRSMARAEAERRFAPDVVCEQISDALEELVAVYASRSSNSRRP